MQKQRDIDISWNRKYWARVAKENGWYTEPFYVQVWVDPRNGEIYDSVSFQGMTKDIIVWESPETEEAPSDYQRGMQAGYRMGVEHAEEYVREELGLEDTGDMLDRLL